MPVWKFGFTLIELLVTIAVMAVIAAAVLVAIDPQDKIRGANDSRSQANIGQVATAINTYTANNSGSYPVAADWAALDTALDAELANMPVAPGGYTYTGVGTATTAVVRSNLLSKKYAGTPASKCPSTSAATFAFWYWNTITGGACGYCGATATSYPSAAQACVWSP